MINFKGKNTWIIALCLIGSSLTINGVFSDNVNNKDFSNENVGWVGKTPIKNIEYLKYKEYLKSKNPEISNSDVIKKIGERKATLLYAEKNLNITASNEEIINEITSNKIFIDGDSFSEKKYKDFLRKNQLSASDYEENIKENIIFEKLISLTKIKNNSKESYSIYKNAMTDSIDISLYSINYHDIKVDGKNKDDIFDFYRENESKMFTTPSYKVNIKKYKINEKYVNEKYNAFMKNPKGYYKGYQILFDSEEKAKQLIEDYKNLTESELFTKFKVVDLGFLEEDTISPDFKEGLKNSELNKPIYVKSSFAYHVLVKTNYIKENLTYNQFLEINKDEINNWFKDDIINGNVKESSSSEAQFIKETLQSFDKSKKVDINTEYLLGDNGVYEKLKVIGFFEERKLDINNENDFKTIESLLREELKIKEADKIAMDIITENLKTIPFWLESKNLNIRKNTKLPQQLLDLIFSTKIGSYNKYLSSDKLYVFKVNNIKEESIKDKDLKNIYDYAFDYESGMLLINEALKQYPIRISKKIL